MSPDQKGIETAVRKWNNRFVKFTMSPDQKGIETLPKAHTQSRSAVHNEPRSKGD